MFFLGFGLLTSVELFTILKVSMYFLCSVPSADKVEVTPQEPMMCTEKGRALCMKHYMNKELFFQEHLCSSVGCMSYGNLRTSLRMGLRGVTNEQG